VVATDQLPRKGTEKLVARASAALGHDVDVAYEVHTLHPVVLLVALVAGITGVLVPAAGLRVACFVVFGICMVAWTATGLVLALRDDDVWLMSSGWFSTRLSPPSLVATRADIRDPSNGPMSSVRLGGHRLWFFVNQRGIAEMLPTTEPVEGPVP
jgi:hypothetical protein